MDWIQQGELAITRGDFTAAERCFRNELARSPKSMSAMRGLGYTLMLANQLPEALELLENVVRLSPSDLVARQLFGRLCLRLQAPDLAAVHFQRILESMPGNVAALSGLLDVNIARNRLADAGQLVERMLAVAPNSEVALTAAANFLELAGEPGQALEMLQELVAAYPGNRLHTYHLSRGLLKAGQYAEGWQAYESRLGTVTEPLQLSAPMWDGSAGREVLLVAEQGLGDAVMFARFVRHVRRTASRVVLACHAPLVDLFARSFDISVVPFEHASTQSFEAFCPLPSLPHVLGIGDGVRANPARYLSADPSSVSRWKERLQGDGEAFRIGVVYQCSVAHSTEAFVQKRRTCDPKWLAPLGEIPGATFYDLQVGNASPLSTDGRWTHLGAQIRNFDDTVGILENLDLLVTVDTAAAHVAGALGRPFVLMLPYSSDWRWGAAATTTAWYETATIFRQSAPGDWQELVDRVGRHLGSLVRS